MDFVHDRLVNGRKLRILNIVDDSPEKSGLTRKRSFRSPEPSCNERSECKDRGKQVNSLRKRSFRMNEAFPKQASPIRHFEEFDEVEMSSYRPFWRNFLSSNLNIDVTCPWFWQAQSG